MASRTCTPTAGGTRRERNLSDPVTTVLTLADIPFDTLHALLGRHGLTLELVTAGGAIPGSYWGEPEAGLIGTTVYARSDTPLHSLLHEASHLMCAVPERRALIHTDASDCQFEEDAACYLQILLGEQLPGVGSERVMSDMDAWGYSFRLGSTRAWFEHDAEDARAWLQQRDLLPVATESLAAVSLADAALPH